MHKTINGKVNTIWSMNNLGECVDEERIPLIGEKFPEMHVETTHGMLKIPNDLRGKWFMLFSHPGDFTPVCTTEFLLLC